MPFCEFFVIFWVHYAMSLVSSTCSFTPWMISHITSNIAQYFCHFREYSLNVNKHICNPEAILLQTHDFRCSIANFLVKNFHFNIVTILQQCYVQYCCKVIKILAKVQFNKYWKRHLCVQRFPLLDLSSGWYFSKGDFYWCKFVFSIKKKNLTFANIVQPFSNIAHNIVAILLQC